MDDWNELNALRGLSPRQRRLLHLEALVMGTGYADLEPWDAVDQYGVPVPACERQPQVQIGILAEKVTKLTRRLSGSGAFPAIDGVEPIKDALAQLRLERALPLAARDLVAKGTGVIGFARVGNAQSGRFEPLLLEPEWCEPLFVAQAGGERARQLSAELADLGVTMPEPPEDADSHDLVFLRHEWRVDEEVAGAGGGVPRKTKTTRHRRDYLPQVILEYRPIEVGSGDQFAPKWELAEPPRPHNWGVVPVVWIRSPWAKPGDIDGPSFITPELETLARAADYTESLATDSVGKIAWPQLALIDLKDKVDAANRELGAFDLGIAPKRSSSSAEVMELKSSSPQFQGKAQILEINGQGPTVAATHVERLKAHADRLTGLADFDQAKAAGTLSGVALERMMEPLIATVEEWRGPLGDGLVLLCRKIGQVLGQAVEPVVRWPRVVAVTPADLSAAAQALSTATGGQAVVSQETAAKIFAQLAEIPDVEQELARLDEDADAAMQRAKNALMWGGQKDGDGDGLVGE